MRPKVIINCWAMNESESATIWDLFTEADSAGVAIQTTFKRLLDSLDKVNSEEISIGRVKYIEYDKE